MLGSDSTGVGVAVIFEEVTTVETEAFSAFVVCKFIVGWRLSKCHIKLVVEDLYDMFCLHILQQALTSSIGIKNVQRNDFFLLSMLGDFINYVLIQLVNYQQNLNNNLKMLEIGTWK